MFDCLVIGGGAAGTACALRLQQLGCETALVEREPHLGGILMQCIHNGFGLHRFGDELTGPEYAERFIRQIPGSKVKSFLQSTAVSLEKNNDAWNVGIISPVHGAKRLTARSVIFAAGCRERNRGEVCIPGDRPAGIMTAGLAQRLLNIDGYVPGSEAVIVGSGDIGLIMARRLTWAGMKVKAVIEIMPYAAGLARNVHQCLEDFDIPLHLSHSVCAIKGKDRVERVVAAPLVDGYTVMDKAFEVPCDTVLLSVGLIPQVKMLGDAGAELNPATGGTLVDSSRMTTLNGVFNCGNSLHVHDLVDYVSDEAEACADSVAEWLSGERNKQTVTVTAGANLKYVIPNRVVPGEDTEFMFRSLHPVSEARLDFKVGDTVISSQKRKQLRPSEMGKFKLKSNCWPDSPVEKCCLEIISEGGEDE